MYNLIIIPCWRCGENTIEDKIVVFNNKVDGLYCPACCAMYPMNYNSKTDTNYPEGEKE